MVQFPFPQFLRRLVLLTATAFALMASVAAAQNVTLAWNANPETNIRGYLVQYGTQSGSPSSTIDVGNVTSRAFTSLAIGSTYYFRVIAYNTSGQNSQPSTQVSYAVTGPTGTAPTISGVSPTSGPAAGGTLLTITGTNFVSGARVDVGGRSATTTYVSSSQLRASTPTGSGTVAVTVTNPNGQSVVRANAFTYTTSGTAPTMTSVSPTSGPLSGGTQLTIVGTGFVSGATVLVGTRSATATFVSSTQVRASTPTGAAAGATSVRLTNPNGQSVTLSNAFTYVSSSTIPTITSVSPATGLLSGGTQLTIIGTNFATGVRVTVGSRSATTVFISSTQIKASTPTGAATGPVSITVTNANGQSVTRTGLFSYVASYSSSSLTSAMSAASTMLAEDSPEHAVVDPVDATAALDVAADTARAAADSDGDGLPNDWETRYGLDPLSADGDNGALGDPDRDGVNNADEYRLGTHPRGLVRRALANGANTSDAATRLALANADSSDAAVVLSFTDANGKTTRVPLDVPARQRRTFDASSVAALRGQTFSVLLESDRMVDLERLSTWGRRQSASTLTAAAEPSTHWYFADGSTTKPFELWYVIENPGATAADLQIRYLLPGDAAPIVSHHVVAPGTREAIRVDREDARLESTDVAAEVVSGNDVPVIVERSQYLVTGTGAVPGGGDTTTGVAKPATSWWLAGVTGRDNALYLLLANPTGDAAVVEATYVSANGRPVVKRYEVAANSRATVDVAKEDPALASTALGIHVESTTPIVAERTVWWGSNGEWNDGLGGAAAAAPSSQWLMAEGEDGGTRGAFTSLTVFNTSGNDAEVRVTLLFEGAPEVSQTFKVGGSGLLAVPMAKAFPSAAGRRFAVLVEDVAGAASLIVDRGLFWTTQAGQIAGSGAPAVPLR